VPTDHRRRMASFSILRSPPPVLTKAHQHTESPAPEDAASARTNETRARPSEPALPLQRVPDRPTTLELKPLPATRIPPETASPEAFAPQMPCAGGGSLCARSEASTDRVLRRRPAPPSACPPVHERTLKPADTQTSRHSDQKTLRPKDTQNRTLIQVSPASSFCSSPTSSKITLYPCSSNTSTVRGASAGSTTVSPRQSTFAALDSSASNTA